MKCRSARLFFPRSSLPLELILNKYTPGQVCTFSAASVVPIEVHTIFPPPIFPNQIASSYFPLFVFPCFHIGPSILSLHLVSSSSPPHSIANLLLSLINNSPSEKSLSPFYPLSPSVKQGYSSFLQLFCTTFPAHRPQPLPSTKGFLFDPSLFFPPKVNSGSPHP